MLKAGQAVPYVDIWLIDPARGTNARFTFVQGINALPVWSPDGRHIIFASSREGTFNLYQKVASGIKDEEVLLKSANPKYPTSWSSDGRFLLYTAVDPKTKDDLWVLPLEGDRKPMPFLRTEFNELDGHLSPDMRWVAYTSDESGNNEIYVRGFLKASGTSSDTGGKWQVSQGGGAGPRWRKDGKELYYLAPNGDVMVVQITAGTVLQLEKPKALFHAPPLAQSALPISSWDVAPDGNRFLLSRMAAEATPSPFTVVLNWQAGLNK
jgi:Tol biopolymer transport system component